MEAKKIPETILNSGQNMPLIGMGTAAIPLPPFETLIPIFIDAIEAGYRHFDTAALYGSEEPLGQAVAKAKLGLEYVDLYLIHWPVWLKPEAGGAAGAEFRKDYVIPFDIKETWQAMEECQRMGLAKSIGVSNFGIKKLTKLLENATIPPSVNQVEMNVTWQQGKLIEFCKQKGIHVSAWSPLGACKTTWGSNSVMESPILKEIATARHKSMSQVALRWIYEQGASVIVKSFNKERMKQNLDIFEWELSQEETMKISQIPQRRVCTGEEFVSEDGPYKSLEELWDGDP
ncbi:hypothetical protein PIB30_074387 [Stylosanthes scabra]|uniref:NADP-dependent oxidoreductase domain-containing protein n=1 Tax=Stylosanthes scabra TaxID=79078 RepID=A0ABU6XPD8_9FABA|nr:hypothetical protein [Stylosanthes scabra]